MKNNYIESKKRKKNCIFFYFKKIFIKNIFCFEKKNIIKN